jgi:hypothetical protein
MRLGGLFALLLVTFACNCERSNGVVVSGVDLPVNWALHSDPQGRFSLLVSKFERDKGSVWLCRSKATAPNESPDFKQTECFLDLKARGGFGGWSRFQLKGDAYVVVPVQETVNELALMMYSDKDSSVTDLRTTCLSLPNERAIAGADQERVVALGFGCRLDCTDGLYVLRANGDGQGECFRELRRVVGVSDTTTHFLEWTTSTDSALAARTWGLSPGDPARILDTLSFGVEEAVTQVGRYGTEPRFFAYHLDKEGRRAFRDDVVVQPDGNLVRAPSRLASLVDPSRILDSASSPDLTSTFLLLQSQSSEGSLEIVRIDASENRLLWRRPLKASFTRSTERIAASRNGVGYWASRAVEGSDKFDVWFEFLAN